MGSEGVKYQVIVILAIATGLSVFPLSSGCMTLEEMAPPVGGELQIVAARHGVDTTTLELGRQIYLSDCVKCHSVEPIGRYAAEHWRDILPRMAQKTKLDAQRSEAVEAYVTSARVLLAEIAKAEGEIATSRGQTLRDNTVDTYPVREGD